MVISTQRVVLSYLLNPFWNHWLSLQSDWLSVVWFIQESHHFLLKIFFSVNENGTVKQKNQSDSKVRLKWSIKFQENERQKVIVWRILQLLLQNFIPVFLLKLCDFKMDLIKWQLNLVSCNFGLKSYLRFQIELVLALVWFWNHVYDFRPNYTPLSSITIINLTLKYDIWMPPLQKLVNLIVITPSEFIELSQENYHLMLKSCF